MDSQPITRVMVVRQETEPGKKIDGKQWINPTGGQNGNNSETYIWNADSQAWELTRSVGPDTPLYPATGADWRDTANGTTKTYDGSGWVNVGVTKADNLTDLYYDEYASGYSPSLQNGDTGDDRVQMGSAVSGGATGATRTYTLGSDTSNSKKFTREKCRVYLESTSGDLISGGPLRLLDSNGNELAAKSEGNWSMASWNYFTGVSTSAQVAVVEATVDNQDSSYDRNLYIVEAQPALQQGFVKTPL